MPICRDFYGSDGLEPATSSVTGVRRSFQPVSSSHRNPVGMRFPACPRCPPARGLSPSCARSFPWRFQGRVRSRALAVGRREARYEAIDSKQASGSTSSRTVCTSPTCRQCSVNRPSPCSTRRKLLAVDRRPHVELAKRLLACGSHSHGARRLEERRPAGCLSSSSLRVSSVAGGTARRTCSSSARPSGRRLFGRSS
jgi:hypothetical protein